MAGAIDDSGRLPGAIALPAAKQAEGIRRAWLGGEVVHLVVEQKAGAVHRVSAAEGQVERVGVGNGVTVLVHNGKMRGLIAFRAGGLARRNVLRSGRMVEVDALAKLPRVVLAEEARDGHFHVARIAQIFGPVGISPAHRLGQPVNAMAGLWPTWQVVAFEDVQYLDA